MIQLNPHKLNKKTLNKAYLGRGKIGLDPILWPAIERARQIVDNVVHNDQAVYGINTGFGKLASVKIDRGDSAQLQENLILSHAAGVGDYCPPLVVRLMMISKILGLSRGASGVRPLIIDQLLAFCNQHITPLIPIQGSVGASGDLAPLAHLTACMMGHGRVLYKGRVFESGDILAKLGLKPLQLQAKEGLALINGTQFCASFLWHGLTRLNHYFHWAMVVNAMAIDGLMGSSTPFLPEIHALRGHAGQMKVAHHLNQLLSGSQIRHSHLEGDNRVQDPYSFRCSPQVLGACHDIMVFVERTCLTEICAVSDNPIILSDGQIVSGGNFHAEPVALGADQLALAIAEMGAISQRRIATLVDPALNFGLPAFLSPNAGLNSGFMVAEITSAALMSENKFLATPCAIDSTPTSANQEDHVSMGAHATVRLHKMLDNLAHILAIEMMVAIQAIELRRPLLSSPAIEAVIDQYRQSVPFINRDQYMADHLTHSRQFIDNQTPPTIS